MAFIFRKDDVERANGPFVLPAEEDRPRHLWQEGLYMLTMVLILIFAAWAKPEADATGFWPFVYAVKWPIVVTLLIVLVLILRSWFQREELKAWLDSTWWFMKQILPLLLVGVLAAGFLLGRPGHPALIPESYVQALVGGNSLWANLFASVAGAFMYFATLTEVPILQGLIGSGMGQGPALALLLAGPALSLPNMIVIGSVMGVKKTAVFCFIIIGISTVAGMFYGWMTG
jgi:hypothetical protein